MNLASHVRVTFATVAFSWLFASLAFAANPATPITPSMNIQDPGAAAVTTVFAALAQLLR